MSITSNNTSELVCVNGDKRGGWMGPWYSKDCVYEEEVYIDTTNFTLGIRDYDEVPYTTPRGKYTAEEIVKMIADVINEMCVEYGLGTYLVYVAVDSGGALRISGRNYSVPRFILRCDNPYIEIIPGPYAEPNGVYLNCRFTFYRNWHIKMPELTSPYDFALAVYNGLSETNLENGYTYSNREFTLSFKQPTRVHFVDPPSFNADGFRGFIDWEQETSYEFSTTIRFPYHVMVLDSSDETPITYTDDTQTHTWIIPSHVTQDELVWYMNTKFTFACGVQTLKPNSRSELTGYLV